MKISNKKLYEVKTPHVLEEGEISYLPSDDTIYVLADNIQDVTLAFKNATLVRKVDYDKLAIIGDDILNLR